MNPLLIGGVALSAFCALVLLFGSWRDHARLNEIELRQDSIEHLMDIIARNLARVVAQTENPNRDRGREDV
jgi:hypothetical protein